MEKQIYEFLDNTKIIWNDNLNKNGQGGSCAYLNRFLFIFVPAESERGFVAIVGSVFHLCIFTPSHSYIFSCSHRLIFIFTSSHCHIYLHSRFSCFNSLSFFISAHLFTTSPSHLLIFKSSQLQMYSLCVNAHLHI